MQLALYKLCLLEHFLYLLHSLADELLSWQGEKVKAQCHRDNKLSFPAPARRPPGTGSWAPT